MATCRVADSECQPEADGQFFKTSHCKNLIFYNFCEYFINRQPQKHTQPTYGSNQRFLKKIDEIPMQAAGWICDIVTSPGNQLTDDGEPMPPERLELWRRNPVECVKELMGNPVFKDLLEYAPQRHFMDQEGVNCMFDEMWTGDWWWDTQVKLLLVVNQNTG